MAGQTAIKVHDCFSVIKNAPQEIHAINRDIMSFYTLVSSLEGSLSSTTVFNIVNGDSEIGDAIMTLKSPIENCNGALNRIMQKIEPYLKIETPSPSPETENAGSPPVRRTRINSTGVLWFFKRKEIFALAVELERTKATFGDAMGSVNMYVRRAHPYLRLLLQRS
jgi:hypothetical protein